MAAHAHTHDHVDWAARIPDLRRVDELDAVAYARIAARLTAALPAGATVVDVGSGAGGMSAALSFALARRGGGTLLLVDAVPELLVVAAEAAASCATTAPATTASPAASVGTLGSAGADERRSGRAVDGLSSTAPGDGSGLAAPTRDAAADAAGLAATTGAPGLAGVTRVPGLADTTGAPGLAGTIGKSGLASTTGAPELAGTIGAPGLAAADEAELAVADATRLAAASGESGLAATIDESGAAADGNGRDARATGSSAFSGAPGVARAGSVEIRTIHADVVAQPLRDLVPAADLVWAASMIHHLPDQQAGITGLASALSPGGVLAVAEGGLESQTLPWDLGVGEPGLERRLMAARDEWFGAMRASMDGAVRMPYGWTAALTRAGLTGVSSFTVLTDHPAPPTDQVRRFVTARLDRLVETVQDRIGDDDRETVRRLLDPSGPDFVGDRDDVYLLSSRTVHFGRRS